MEIWTVVIGVLGAGIGSGLMSLVLELLRRRWSRKDNADNRLDDIMEALRTIMVDRICWLGEKYIARGYITLQEKENLVEMDRVYKKALGGKNHVDTVMAEAQRLPVTTGKERSA